MAIHLKQNKNGVVHTEYSIQKILVRAYMSGAKYMVPNMHYKWGEMDMFMLRRSGYAEEFEIKISTSDLRADFKKRKHCWLNKIYQTFKDSHCLLSLSGFKIPNKFSYVVSDEVNISEITFPVYAGLYTIHPVSGRLICLTAPKFIHKHKYDWHGKVAASCSHRLLKAYKLRY